MAEIDSVGGRLRHVREQRGLSLEVLAERSGVSKSFLWEVEQDRSGISGERLLQVANVLDTSLDYLLRGEPSTGFEQSDTIEIPRELSELAEELGLSYAETLALLDIDRSLIARRRRAGRPHMSKPNWEQLYEGIAPFLEDRS